MGKLDMRVIRGRTESFILTVADADGGAYALADGEVLRFGVKHTASSTTYLLVKEMTATDASESGYLLTLTPEDTAEMPSGHHVYDVGLQSGSDYYTVIEPSEFELVANVTAKEG